MVSYGTYARTIDSMSDKIIWVKLALVNQNLRLPSTIVTS